MKKDLNPITLSDVIEQLIALKEEHGNLEIRRYEFRYLREPTLDSYPKFCMVPTDREGEKIIVTL